MHLPRRRLLALWAGAMWPLQGCAPMLGSPGAAGAPADYAATVRDVLRSYASDMQGYHFRATPVGNFGVGSIYLDDIGDPQMARVDSSWYLGGPDTWLDAAPAERSRALGRLVAEGSLGSFSMNGERARAINAQAGFAILSVLDANASLDYSKGVDTSVEASEVRNRRLNWAEFEGALASGRVNPSVSKVVREGRFVVAAADIVLVGYRAAIRVDERLNPALAASLRTNLLLPQLRRGGASFSLTEGARGQFLAAAKEPVVAAVLFKRPPPRSKDLGGKRPPLEAWPTLHIDSRAVDAVESGVLGARR